MYARTRLQRLLQIQRMCMFICPAEVVPPAETDIRVVNRHKSKKRGHPGIDDVDETEEKREQPKKDKKPEPKLRRSTLSDSESISDKESEKESSKGKATGRQKRQVRCFLVFLVGPPMYSSIIQLTELLKGIAQDISRTSCIAADVTRTSCIATYVSRTSCITTDFTTQCWKGQNCLFKKCLCRKYNVSLGKMMLILSEKCCLSRKNDVSLGKMMLVLSEK